MTDLVGNANCVVSHAKTQICKGHLLVRRRVLVGIVFTRKLEPGAVNNGRNGNFIVAIEEIGFVSSQNWYIIHITHIHMTFWFF